MNIPQQKLVADEILDRVSILDPSAIVAGGAPRNWELGRLAKDIDVFVYFPRSIQGQGVFFRTLGKLIPGTWKTLAGDDTSQYKANEALEDVYELTHESGNIVQIVRINEHASSAVGRFPLSISKVSYLRGRVEPTSDFLASVKHKAIWKTKESYSSDHPYIQKVLADFPDYKYFSSKLSFLESLV